jgi:hypothetical protein
MTAGVHRPLEVIVLNASAIARQCYELSKQLQELHIDMALLSEIRLKHHERFSIPNYHIIGLTASQAEKTNCRCS